jgi:hypothetical protein
MGTSHTPADDIVYDLVSIQYHALKGAELYDKFMQDAEGHDDVAEFVSQVRDEDARRAERCHELLRMLTKEHGLQPSSMG